MATCGRSISIARSSWTGFRATVRFPKAQKNPSRDFFCWFTSRSSAKRYSDPVHFTRKQTIIMHTLTRSRPHNETFIDKLFTKVQEVSGAFLGWWHHTVTLRHSINASFPTIILTETRGKRHPQSKYDLHLHSSHDMLEVEKPTWAEWRTQMSSRKKSERGYGGEHAVHVRGNYDGKGAL